jgi:MFS family permease
MKKKSKNRIIGAFLGTIVEYYDYSLYGFSAGIIASKFFPYSDHLTGLINVFAVYAIAYLSKPIGSLVFGYIGDHYGRKIALSTTIIGIVIPTIFIGLLPEYSVVGSWGPFILVICRFMQGIFIAGEYDGAAIYVIEHLGEKFQSTASSITRCTGVIGLLLGIGATNFFNAHIFPEWGWRIPFLLSLPFALITLYYRQKFDETPDFKEANEQSLKITRLSSLIKEQWPTIILVIFLAGGFGATYQISIIFMKQYLPLVLPQTTFIISTFSVLLVLCFGISMPISGLIADRTSPIKVTQFSLFGTIIASFLLSIAILYEMINLSLIACLMLAVFVAPFNALAHGTIIKAFPVKMRYRGISLGHTIGSVLMSGPANYICLVLMQLLHFNLFPILYVVFSAILSYFMLIHLEHRVSKKSL